MIGLNPTTRLRSLLAGVALCALPALAPAGDYYSEINGYSCIDSTRFEFGGADIGYVEHEMQLAQSLANSSHVSTVGGVSSATLGRIGGYLGYDIEVTSLPSQAGTCSTADNYAGDVFTIAPSEAYPEYAPIDFFAEVYGTVHLEGRPSGGSYVGAHVTFWYTNEGGPTFRRFEYTLASMYPPIDDDYRQPWSESDNVKVGTPIRVVVLFTMDMNGSAHDVGDSASNYVDFMHPDPLGESRGMHFGLAAGAAGVGEITSLALDDSDVDGDGVPADAGDCDDFDPEVHPGAIEICDDGVDNDCDGLVDSNDEACTACDDGDGDGVCDVVDNCPAIPNIGQLDSDGDGVGDACDNCPGDHNDDQADWDGDLIGDNCDNCPTIANADQVDSDSDGIGEACEDSPIDLAVVRIAAPRTIRACGGERMIRITVENNGYQAETGTVRLFKARGLGDYELVQEWASLTVPVTGSRRVALDYAYDPSADAEWEVFWLAVVDILGDQDPDNDAMMTETLVRACL